MKSHAVLDKRIQGNRRKFPRFYFSFRSPYSWLAYLDLRDSIPVVLSSLELIPFWEPDEEIRRQLEAAGGSFTYTPMSAEKHRYILQDVRRLTRQRGLTAVWPLDRDPCWEVPHLGYLVADEQDRGLDFIDRVYRGRWIDGVDICNPDVLAALAEDVDLDGDLVAGAHRDSLRRAQAVDILELVDRAGVFGVPFFTCGYEKYWGLDRLAAFVEYVATRDTGDRTEPDTILAWLRRQKPASLHRQEHDSDWGPVGGCG